jgi:hypothetical protein
MIARASLAVLASLIVACAASGATDQGGGDDFDGGVPFADGGHANDSSIPPPDALVLADGDTTQDASDDSPPPPGSCVGKPDGTVCVKSPDGCHTDATCSGGLCGGLGTRADGYNWKAGDDNARCCNGKPIETTTNDDCGACGIRCNAGNGESCQPLGGHYFCRGCVASAACWSKCCSTSFSPNSCAASDCAGNCNNAVCPPGSHCVNGLPNSSDYCAY